MRILESSLRKVIWLDKMWEMFLLVLKMYEECKIKLTKYDEILNVRGNSVYLKYFFLCHDTLSGRNKSKTSLQCSHCTKKMENVILQSRYFSYLSTGKDVFITFISIRFLQAGILTLYTIKSLDEFL